MVWLYVAAALLAPLAIIWIAEHLPRAALGVVVLALLAGWVYKCIVDQGDIETQEAARHRWWR